MPNIRGAGSFPGKRVGFIGTGAQPPDRRLPYP